MTDPRSVHNAYQSQLFDADVGCFERPIPADVEARTQHIVDAVPLGPSSRVLDVGTGVGLLVPYLQARGVRHIIGCDLSGNMLAEARARHPGVEFWQGDVTDFPRARAGFDAIFCNAMFGNVWDQREVLAACAELANAGGRLAISHPMGATFVDRLKASDPRMVLHDLPSRAALMDMIRGLPWRIERFVDAPDYYLALLLRG